MTSLTAPTDFYLLLVPTIFGFVFAFVIGLGIYQCATLTRVKEVYQKRNRVLKSRLSHSLHYCDKEGVTSVYETLRELEYSDLYDNSSEDEEGLHRSRHTHNDNSSDNSSSSSSYNCDRNNEEHQRHGGDAGVAPHCQHTNASQNARSRSSSLVLEEVSMLDSDEESDES
jgi:hypothetical protein